MGRRRLVGESELELRTGPGIKTRIGSGTRFGIRTRILAGFGVFLIVLGINLGIVPGIVLGTVLGTVLGALRAYLPSLAYPVGADSITHG